MNRRIEGSYENDNVQIGGDGLACPHCEEFYLHQYKVEIGWRDYEDGPVTRYVSDGKTAITDRLEDKEVIYGYRRDYVLIHFWCEICAATPKLEIRQHKGATLFHWVGIKGEKPEFEVYSE